MHQYYFHENGVVPIIMSDALLFVVGIVSGVILTTALVAYFISKDLFITPLMKGSKLDMIKVVDKDKANAFTFVNPRRKWTLNIGILFWLLVWIVSGRRKDVVLMPEKLHTLIAIIFLLVLLIAFFVAGDGILFVQHATK